MPDRNFVCDACGDGFRTEMELQEHKLMFHPPEINDEEMDEEQVTEESRPNSQARTPGRRLGARAAPGRSRKSTSD
jgi:hypothetical protein